MSNEEVIELSDELLSLLDEADLLIKREHAKDARPMLFEAKRLVEVLCSKQ